MIKRWGFVALTTVCVAACNDVPEQVPPPAATASATPQPTPTPEPERTSNGARAVAEETDDFLFKYTYPVEAGAIPALAGLLDRRLDERRAALARSSAQAQRDARADGFPYNKHSYTAEWKVVADLPDWLSLSNAFATYEGGAHGNYGVDSLVWNKDQERALLGIDLFTSPAALEEALGERFCEALNKERAERRDAPVEPPEEDEENSFDSCPGIEELTVLVGSSNGRRFDRLTLYAGPYVAGPYAEGAYEVALPVDEAVRQAVRPEYRDSFAARN